MLDLGNLPMRSFIEMKVTQGKDMCGTKGTHWTAYVVKI